MSYLIIMSMAAATLAYTVYLHFSSVKWTENERRELERLDVRITHILRLLNAPDVRMLMTRQESRRELFMQFSESIHRDILEFVGSRPTSLATLALAGLFFLSYYLLRTKARVYCSHQDILFLTGVELALLRAGSGGR